MQFIGIAVAIVAFIVWIVASKSFRNQTGVSPPSRKQWTAAKRRGRARGVSDAQVLVKWIERQR